MSQFGRPPASSRNAAPCVGVAALLLLVVVFAPVAQTPDEAVREHILPVVNRTGEAQFDTVASTVTDTVSLTLRLLGSYRISRSETTDATSRAILPSARDERLATLARLAADVLSGFSGSRVAFGSTRISPQIAAPTDAEEGGGAETADGIPSPAADPVPYTVILDGKVVGENLRSLDSVLTGSHRPGSW